MARKSRKNIMPIENTVLPEGGNNVFFRAGLYARLSHEKEEGELFSSIE